MKSKGEAGKSLSRNPHKVFPLDPNITDDNPCKKYREIVRSNLRLQPINPLHPEEGKAVETGSKITPCLAVFSDRPHIRKKKEGFLWSRNNTSDAPLLSFSPSNSRTVTFLPHFFYFTSVFFSFDRNTTAPSPFSPCPLSSFPSIPSKWNYCLKGVDQL